MSVHDVRPLTHTPPHAHTHTHSHAQTQLSLPQNPRRSETDSYFKSLSLARLWCLESQMRSPTSLPPPDAEAVKKYARPVFLVHPPKTVTYERRPFFGWPFPAAGVRPPRGDNEARRRALERRSTCVVGLPRPSHALHYCAVSAEGSRLPVTRKVRVGEWKTYYSFEVTFEAPKEPGEYRVRVEGGGWRVESELCKVSVSGSSPPGGSSSSPLPFDWKVPVFGAFVLAAADARVRRPGGAGDGSWIEAALVCVAVAFALFAFRRARATRADAREESKKEEEKEDIKKAYAAKCTCDDMFKFLPDRFKRGTNAMNMVRAAGGGCYECA